MTGKHDRIAAWVAALIWLLCAATMIHSDWYYVHTVDFRDPDDALRLVEVRNWLAGQSWFDVTQYRSHPPTGGPMHWSRLVDIPIAFFIRLYGLLAAPAMAERLALVTVPLLMLGGLTAILFRLTVRLTGRAVGGVVAAAMLATSVGVLVQFHPMRIDHHGWQITLGLLAIQVMIARSGDGRRNAALGGLIMAVNLIIALETLPLAVALGGVLALRALRRPEALAELFIYVLTLGGGAAVLLPVMLGHGALVPWCDSMSPAYVLPLLLVALLLGGAMRFVPRARLWQRLAIMAVAGAAGAALLARVTPQCLAGPFGNLDPLVYRLWFLGIKEGLPVWTQPADLEMLVTLPSMLGLVGTLLAIRFDAAERRGRWIEMLVVQGVAFAVSLTVMRAMGLAHVTAMPGNAWLFLAALGAAMRLRTPVGRVLLGFSCFILTPLAGEALAIGLLTAGGYDTGEGGHANKISEAWDSCVTRRGFEQLNAIPKGEILTPLDIGSHMLAFTHHDVVATGHHRNVAGMKTVISFFIADPDQAHAIILATPARYVGFCPTENEGKRYAGYPNGMMARLMQDRPPAWLKRMKMERKDDIHFYRVVD